MFECLFQVLIAGVFYVAPIAIILSTGSLEYYVIKKNADAQRLSDFLNKLRPPVATFYSKDKINLIFGMHKENIEVLFIEKSSIKRATVIRIFCTFLLLIPIVGLQTTIKGDNYSSISCGILGIITYALTGLWAWKFGNKV